MIPDHLSLLGKHFSALSILSSDANGLMTAHHPGLSYSPILSGASVAPSERDDCIDPSRSIQSGAKLDA